MTDLDKFTKMLDSFGVLYSKVADKEQVFISIENSSEKGYTGFSSDWVFTREDGKFSFVAHYEE